MVTLDNLMYCNKIASEVATLIINDVCVKNRYGTRDLNNEQILNMINNFEDIAIQDGLSFGATIDIYCRDIVANQLAAEITHNKYFNKAFQKGFIKIYTKDGEMTDIMKTNK